MILLVHGGAGQETLTSKEARVYRTALISLLQKSRNTDLAEKAVLKAIRYMEDHPYFNAGVGAALASDGLPYTDASLTLSDGQVGAIAASLLATHPIDAARGVMKHSNHNLLVGDKADAWLQEIGLETSDPKTRITKRSLRALQEVTKQSNPKAESFATVGAVAKDDQGFLSAGTSTGGIIAKTPGRVGDSAIIGAGTYCSGECAISFTGSGEEIMNRLSASRIASALSRGQDLKKAVDDELQSLQSLGAYAGCITLLASGQSYIAKNSQTMIAGKRDLEGIFISQFSRQTLLNISSRG